MKIIEPKFKNGLTIRAAAKAKTAEVVIYAGIGDDFWGDGSMISLKNFSDELAKLPKDIESIDLRVSSPGGDVFMGVGIYNRLLDWKRKVSGRTITAYIDGIAASIASIIILAADEIIMGEGTTIMVHLPWTFAWGNRMDFDNTVNRLMDIEEQMLGIYSKKTGLSKVEIRSMLEKETWMDSKEAIEKGFADKEAEDTVPIAASIFKSPWMRSRPDKFVSDVDATKEKIAKLKAKVQSKLAK